MDDVLDHLFSLIHCPKNVKRPFWMILSVIVHEFATSGSRGTDALSVCRSPIASPPRNQVAVVRSDLERTVADTEAGSHDSVYGHGIFRANPPGKKR